MTNEQRTPVASGPLSVVLLAGNESAELELVVTVWIDFLRGRGQPFDLVLVDDGSKDGSAQIADQLAERFAELKVCHHAQPLGLGAALRTGLAEAHQPLLCIAPAERQYLPIVGVPALASLFEHFPDDLAHAGEVPYGLLTQLIPQEEDPEPPALQPTHLGRFFEVIDEVDLVHGVRAAGKIPWWARAAGFCYRCFCLVVFGLPLEPTPCWLGWQGVGRRLLAFWLFGVRLRDPECICVLLRRDMLKRTPLQANGPFAIIELLAKANFIGALITEVPLDVLPTETPWQKNGPSFWPEARLVFQHPDFGPAILEELIGPQPSTVLASDGPTVVEHAAVANADQQIREES